jgi:hypothetical protein
LKYYLNKNELPQASIIQRVFLPPFGIATVTVVATTIVIVIATAIAPAPVGVGSESTI